MSPEDHLSIPGIDLEPLEPFYDDLFGGLDEHPAGPWAHHTLEPPEQHGHFPAIDCCLLDERACAGPPGAAQQADQALPAQPDGLQGLSAAAAKVQPEVAQQAGLVLQQQLHGDASPQHSQQPPLQDTSASPGTAAQSAAAGLRNEPCLGSNSLHCSGTVGSSSSSRHTSCHEDQQQQLLLGPEQFLSVPEACSSSMTAADSSTAGASVAADTQSLTAGADSMQAQGSTAASASADSSSCSDAPESTAAASDAAAAAPTAPTAAAPEQESSSASLPDIDDVPEQSAADLTQLAQQQEQQPQQPQQMQGDEQNSPPMQVDPVQHNSTTSSSAHQPAELSDLVRRAAASACQGSGPAHAAVPQQEQHAITAAASNAPDLVPGPECAAAGAAAEGNPAVPAEAAVPAEGSSSAASADSTQPLSVDPEDFASPVTSWHSCMTSASKASSMTSSRGFFLPAAAVAAAAAAAGTAAAASGAAPSSAAGGAAFVPAPKDATTAAESAAGNRASDVQEQQQQERSGRSGASSPAMVSSLHLALQHQQQQSQHSDSLAAAPAGTDPLSASICHTAPTADAAAEDDAAAAAVVTGETGGQDTAAGAAAADGAAVAASTASLASCAGLGSSQPIAMQRSHEHSQLQQQQQQPGQRADEELWQSVSPPSFSSSPGLLVSAAAARAAAAAAAAAGDGQQPAGGQEASSGDSAATGTETAAAAASDPGSDEAAAVDDVDDDVGNGHFYADAAGLSESPETLGHKQELEDMLAGLHSSQQQQQQGLLPPQQLHQHLAASSYMLRQSELVDLSLSSSALHPAQLQHAQMLHPGWLTAHQQLPFAAAQAVERAVVALDDSVCYQGRTNSPSELLGVAAGTGGASSGVRGGAVGSVAGAIRRSAAGQQWNRAHTQPQQDQQARHRVAHAAHNGAVRPFGWPGAAVLGDWFSSTLQQPLAAAASRAAAGVGQRLGMAHGQHPHQQQQQQRQVAVRQHSSAATGSRAPSHGPAGSAVGGITTSSSGPAGAAGADTAAAAVAAGASADATAAAAVAAEAGGSEDAVLIEKTADLPQSLQEQEDEAFRGLLFLGGRDSQGRPVVIINTDAIPTGHNAAPRDATLAYLLKRLSPIVTHGPYVLVIVALHNGPQFRLLPGVWCVRAYQSLPRAFRKHVKHVVLLQPSMLVKAAVALLYPFVSSKAHAKVKQVQRLLDIDVATRGEVQVPHLGEAFLTTLHHMNSRVREAEDSAYD